MAAASLTNVVTPNYQESVEQPRKILHRPSKTPTGLPGDEPKPPKKPKAKLAQVVDQLLPPEAKAARKLIRRTQITYPEMGSRANMTLYDRIMAYRQLKTENGEEDGSDDKPSDNNKRPGKIERTDTGFGSVDISQYTNKRDEDNRSPTPPPTINNDDKRRKKVGRLHISSTTATSTKMSSSSSPPPPPSPSSSSSTTTLLTTADIHTEPSCQNTFVSSVSSPSSPSCSSSLLSSSTSDNNISSNPFSSSSSSSSSTTSSKFPSLLRWLAARNDSSMRENQYKKHDKKTKDGNSNNRLTRSRPSSTNSPWTKGVDMDSWTQTNQPKQMYGQSIHNSTLYVEDIEETSFIEGIGREDESDLYACADKDNNHQTEMYDAIETEMASPGAESDCPSTSSNNGSAVTSQKIHVVEVHTTDNVKRDMTSQQGESTMGSEDTNKDIELERDPGNNDNETVMETMEGDEFCSKNVSKHLNTMKSWDENSEETSKADDTDKFTNVCNITGTSISETVYDKSLSDDENTNGTKPKPDDKCELLDHKNYTAYNNEAQVKNVFSDINNSKRSAESEYKSKDLLLKTREKESFSSEDKGSFSEVDFVNRSPVVKILKPGYREIPSIIDVSKKHRNYICLPRSKSEGHLLDEDFLSRQSSLEEEKTSKSYDVLNDFDDETHREFNDVGGRDGTENNSERQQYDRLIITTGFDGRSRLKMTSRPTRRKSHPVNNMGWDIGDCRNKDEEQETSLELDLAQKVILRRKVIESLCVDEVKS